MIPRTYIEGNKNINKIANVAASYMLQGNTKQAGPGSEGFSRKGLGALNKLSVPLVLTVWFSWR